jgi:hypothetical protein
MIFPTQNETSISLDLGELIEIALDGYPTYKLASDCQSHLLINRLLEEVFQQRSTREYESWGELK